MMFPKYKKKYEKCPNYDRYDEYEGWGTERELRNYWDLYRIKEFIEEEEMNNFIIMEHVPEEPRLSEEEKMSLFEWVDDIEIKVRKRFPRKNVVVPFEWSED